MPAQGIRAVPKRVRVVIQRRRNDDEDAKVRSSFARLQVLHPPASQAVAEYLLVAQEDMYSYVTLADNHTEFKGKTTVKVEDS